MIKLTTETGSYYEIDLEEGTWSKNSGTVERFWEYAAVPDWLDNRDEVMESGLVDWSRTHGRMFRLPEVGECLYILARDTWWLSTPVVAIEYDTQK